MFNRVIKVTSQIDGPIRLYRNTGSNPIYITKRELAWR